MNLSHQLQAESSEIDDLITHYEQQLSKHNGFAGVLRANIESSEELMGLLHSVRHRVKDPEHLREKLIRKLSQTANSPAPDPITPTSLSKRVTDLVGFRLIHLHTKQFPLIHSALTALLDEHRYEILEGPIAKTWDDEWSDYFRGCGIETEPNQRMYTSVHYVIASNSKARLTCEIQVRTLAEELWGEVDHKLNYPTPTNNQSCREQIKVLARLTSGCSRLVDSIFETHADPSDSGQPVSTEDPSLESA